MIFGKPQQIPPPPFKLLTPVGSGNYSVHDPKESDEPARAGVRGLGDVVALVTKATGIKAVVEYINGGKPCGGCEKRRAAMNRAVPFGKEQQ